MKRHKDLRKLLGKELKDTVTGVTGICTACANYHLGGDMVLVESKDTTGAVQEIWNPIERYETVQ